MAGRATMAASVAASAASSSLPSSSSKAILRPAKLGGFGLIDIGANLLDDMFQGRYHGKERHEPDLDRVLDRAEREGGVEAIICTAGSLEESKAALKFARASSANVYCTVGVHPTRCNEFGGVKNEEDAGDGTKSCGCGSDEVDGGRGSIAETAAEKAAHPASVAAASAVAADHKESRDAVAQQHLQSLREVARDGMSDGRVVAIGEIGLDSDRLFFCSKEQQERCFDLQIQLAKDTGLPMFLHMRNAFHRFRAILEKHREGFGEKGFRGVVHSFTGTAKEAQDILKMGFHLGINGCSLKTEENLEVMKTIPLDRILLETDAPWCGIKRTHASFKYVSTTFQEKKEKKYVPGLCVKGRCEPCHMIQVLEVVAAVKGVEESEVAKKVHKSTQELFFPGQSG